MKKNILIYFLFTILSISAFSQAERKGGGGDLGTPIVSVYPNPAVDFITISNEDAVKSVMVFNALGRKVKTFEVVKGERYEIGDLPNGLYFVQLVSRTNNKVLATQRLTKKS